MKENLNEKYILVDYNSGERAVWEGGVILFDTPNEADLHNDIFKCQYNLNTFSIVAVKFYNIDLTHFKCVNYKDIIDSDGYNLFKYAPKIFPHRPPFGLFINNNGHIRWEDDDIILFNSDEEINEFIHKIENLFYIEEIRCNRISNTAECVFYKDIVNTENFEDKIKEYNQEVIKMDKVITTKTQFLDFIRSKLSSEDFDRKIAMVFKPKTGWKYEVIVPITQVLDETDVIWISNAFSNEQPQLTMQEFMSKLLECDNDKQVIAEVYGYNGERCDQFIYSYLNPEDMTIMSINDSIYIWIKIDQISTYPITYTNVSK